MAGLDTAREKERPASAFHIADRLLGGGCTGRHAGAHVISRAIQQMATPAQFPYPLPADDRPTVVDLLRAGTVCTVGDYRLHPSADWVGADDADGCPRIIAQHGDFPAALTWVDRRYEAEAAERAEYDAWRAAQNP